MARKITTSTDKYGRTVYKITGTKKYAFSLAKAKKIAASLDGASVRKPAKKTARKATRRPAKKTTALARVRKPAKRTAKRDASGRFVKRKSTAKKTTRRNAGRRMTMAQLRAKAGKIHAKYTASKARKGITLAQTKAIAKRILTASGVSPTSAYGREVLASDVGVGVLRGAVAQYAADVDDLDSFVPATLRHSGYFDGDEHSFHWTKTYV